MNNLIYTTDDLNNENLSNFKFFDLIKSAKPEFKVIAFTIAKDLDLKLFEEWWEPRKGWVEIGVHCFSHNYEGIRQECWRDDQAENIEKARNILKPFLLERPLYRPPGFRFLPATEKILKDLGFAGIAHEQFIKYFDTGEFYPVFNTHLTLTEFYNPIGQIWKNLIEKI